MTTTKELLTKAELAELLGVTERTVDRMRDAGAIPYFKHRGTIRFIREQVLETMRQQAVRNQHKAQKLTSIVTRWRR